MKSLNKFHYRIAWLRHPPFPKNNALNISLIAWVLVDQEPCFILKTRSYRTYSTLNVYNYRVGLYFAIMFWMNELRDIGRYLVKWSSMEKGHIVDQKTQNCFQNTQMSYKSGASYNSPAHIRRPSAHTQREADIWGGEQIYNICSADI